MSDLLRQAKSAIGRDDPNAAYTLLTPSVGVADRLQVAECYLDAEFFVHAWAVLSGVAAYLTRAPDEKAKARCDELIVQNFLAWAAAIESAGFPEDHLQLFTKGVNFYANPELRGRHIIDLIGLDQGLQHKMEVTEIWADMIRARGGVMRQPRH